MLAWRRAGAARTAAAGEEAIAGETDQLATATQQAGQQAEKGDFLSGIVKGVAAVASIRLAPFTGGASLAVTAGLAGLGAIH